MLPRLNIAVLGAATSGLSGWAKFVRIAKHARVPKLLKFLKNPVLNFLVPLAAKGISYAIKIVVRKFTKRGSESWLSFSRRIFGI